MNSRPSVFLPVASTASNANNASTTGTSAALKQRQIAALSARLRELAQHTSTLDTLVRRTSVQAESIRRLGILHASLYVSRCSATLRLSFIGASKTLTTQEDPEPTSAASPAQ